MQKLSLIFKYSATTLVILASLFALTSTSIQKAYAEEEFSTEYYVKYLFQKDGTADVEQKIKITNNQNSIAAASYVLTIRNIDVFEIKASDQKDKKYDVEVTQDNKESKIKVIFDKPLRGVGESKEIYLKYKTKGLGALLGEVLSINIPRINSIESINDYQVEITLAKDVGPKIFIAPNPVKTSIKADSEVFYFDKESLRESGIMGSFGKYQRFNFNLDYEIENTFFLTQNKSIALPPRINGVQEVVYSSLDPKPNNLDIDRDGNVIATYVLKPDQILKVSVKGYSKASARQILPTAGGKFEDIPENLLIYTQPQKYWETKDKTITEIANQLKDESLTVAENANKVYKYITTNFTYDYNVLNQSYIERHGAKYAIENKNARAWACMEFTDTFIAITRAMGIPARELNGFALTTDTDMTPLSINIKEGDSLHAWPEFFDPNLGWVQIDPTWGTTAQTDYFTRLDTNRVIFAIKGINSEYPLPAGAYRISDTRKMVDIQIDSGDKSKEPVIKDKVTVTELMDKNFFAYVYNSLVKNSRYVQITNDGNTTLYSVENQVNMPQFDKEKLYINSKATQITYTNQNGEKTTIEANIPALSLKSLILKLFVVYVVPVLCMILIGPVIGLRLLKRLFSRRGRHPQDPNQ